MAARIQPLLTHYADVPDEALADDTITWLRITRPNTISASRQTKRRRLDTVVHHCVHLPRAYQEAFLRRRYADSGTPVHPNLSWYGVKSVGAEGAAVEGVAESLAELKALKVSPRHPGALV